MCEFIYDFEDKQRYSLKVYPLLPKELADEIQASGFSAHEDYGDFQRDFDRMNCDFVIHTARAV